MKKYLSIMALALAAASFTACDKETEGQSWITYYPVLTLEGSPYVSVPAGTPYNDPGCTAELDGQDVTDQVSVTTNMDMSNPKPGYYKINYMVRNADGIEATAQRQLIVYGDLADPAGYYWVLPSSYRFYNGAKLSYGIYAPVRLESQGDGVYYCDDLLCGWYAVRSGYGSDYAMQGYVQIADDGTISLLDSLVPGWNDSANGMTDGKFDPAKGTITWDLSYTDYPFDFVVNLTKVL